MKYSRLLALATSAALLASCTEPDGSPGRGIEHGGALSKTDVSVIVGAAAGCGIGTLIGRGAGETIAIISGVVIGGSIGYGVGQYLDSNDRYSYHVAQQGALENGNREAWSNSQNGHYGHIVPQKSFTNNQGQSCRKYTETVYVGAEKHKAYGTACKQADGSWKIME
jgi:surface antigen